MIMFNLTSLAVYFITRFIYTCVHILTHQLENYHCIRSTENSGTLSDNAYMDVNDRRKPQKTDIL